MDANVQNQTEIVAVLNLIPYLDKNFNLTDEITLAEFIAEYENEFKDNKTFAILKDAVDGNPALEQIVLVDQSSTNETGEWTDDLIQACTFRDAEGNYFITYRGTGDGRWGDNGDGMTAPSTQMQEAAAAYFDKMAEKYLIEASNSGKDIVVSGHSKGGNEAQYVYMAARHEEIIDRCISLDGQGFSKSAIENFQERFGDEYEEKLSNMYSVCGQDDYVHDLGHVIIPEENTYFVPTSGSGFESYHALENMIGSDDGEYSGLSWTDENGNYYEQGEIGKLAKQVSETMMQLDEEDLNGAAVAVMLVLDAAMNGHLPELLSGEFDQYIVGDITVNGTDFIDLIAHGIPAVLEALFLTEGGQAFLAKLIGDGLQSIYEEYGIGGLIGTYLGVAIILVAAEPLIKLVAVAVAGVVLIANILDLIIDTINTIADIADKINQFFTDIKNAVLETINKLAVKLRSYTSGYQYATENPQIQVDTYKLDQYAQRLRTVNTRISKLDLRLDGLYWKVGLLDLWDLMQADLLAGYSWRLSRCAGYLEDTSSDFAGVETDLAGKLQ